MSFDLNATVHAIAEDGLPDMDALTGRVAFLFDGCIVSGWPLANGHWEADSDVGHTRQFACVTHWVEFPMPVRQIEKRPGTHHAPSPSTAS